jgi:hypothetical protein
MILSCGDGSITPDVVIEAGLYSSYVSQSEANNVALQAAYKERALNPCQWVNAQQSYTATCTEGAGSKTITISAGTYTSTTSLDHANALALSAATQAAQEQLVCT